MVNVRSAQPGDICVLLMPEIGDMQAVRRDQAELVRAFGGWKSPEVHITCQRFDAPLSRPVEEILLRLRTVLGKIPSFPILATRLTQFEAPFWQTIVLRWEVDLSPEFSEFIDLLDGSLKEAGLQPHYPHDTPFTCSAVDLVKPVSLDQAPAVKYPIKLFDVRRVFFSRVLGLNDFEMIGYATLKENQWI